MNTAVINIRTDINVKTQAQQLAEEMGLSLSALINGLIKQTLRTKKIEFDLNNVSVPTYQLSKKTVKNLNQAMVDYRAGKFQEITSVSLCLNLKGKPGK